MVTAGPGCDLADPRRARRHPRRAGHSRCYAWRVAMGTRRHPRHLGAAGDPGIEIRGSHVENGHEELIFWTFFC